jgi:outer membrane protein
MPMNRFASAAAFILLASTQIVLPQTAWSQNSSDLVLNAERESQKKVQDAKRVLLEGGKQAAGQAQPVTLMDTLKSMYHYNPDIRAEAENVKSVAEDLAIAMSNFKPDLTANADVTYNKTDVSGGDFEDLEDTGFAFGGGDSSGTSKTGGVTAEQPLFRGGKSVALKRETENLIAAAVARQKAVIQDTIVEAVTAHVDVKRAYALLELNKQNEERLKEQLRAAKLRYDVGELTRTDVSQAEARASEAEANVTLAEAALRTARAEYRRIVGQEPIGLDFPDMIPKLPESLDVARADAMKFNPLLQQAYFTTNAAKHEIGVAKGDLLPEIGVRANYGRTYDPVGLGYDDQDTSSVGLVASMPLYRGGATTARIRQTKAQANFYQQNERATLEQVNRDVLASWEDYAATKAELAAREKQLAAAALAQQSIQLESDVGQRTIIDVLDAEQEFLSAQVDMITSQRDEVVNAYRVAAAVGMLDPISMKLDPQFPDAASVIKRKR